MSRYHITRRVRGTVGNIIELTATNRTMATTIFKSQIERAAAGQEVEMLDYKGNGIARVDYHYTPTLVEQSRQTWDRLWHHIDRALRNTDALEKLAQELRKALDTFTDPTYPLHWGNTALEQAASLLLGRQMRELVVHPDCTFETVHLWLKDGQYRLAKYPKVNNNLLDTLLSSYRLAAITDALDTLEAIMQEKPLL